jgi:hypothetical protein
MSVIAQEIFAELCKTKPSRNISISAASKSQQQVDTNHVLTTAMIKRENREKKHENS